MMETASRRHLSMQQWNTENTILYFSIYDIKLTVRGDDDRVIAARGECTYILVAQRNYRRAHKHLLLCVAQAQLCAKNAKKRK